MEEEVEKEEVEAVEDDSEEQVVVAHTHYIDFDSITLFNVETCFPIMITGIYLNFKKRWNSKCLIWIRTFLNMQYDDPFTIESSKLIDMVTYYFEN